MSQFFVSLKKGCWDLTAEDAKVHIFSERMTSVLMDLIWKAYSKQENQTYYVCNTAFHVTVEAADALNIVLVYKYELEFCMMLNKAGKASIQDHFHLTSTPVFTPSGTPLPEGRRLTDDVDLRLREMAAVFNGN